MSETRQRLQVFRESDAALFVEADRIARELTAAVRQILAIPPELIVKAGPAILDEIRSYQGLVDSAAVIERDLVAAIYRNEMRRELNCEPLQPPRIPRITEAGQRALAERLAYVPVDGGEGPPAGDPFAPPPAVEPIIDVDGEAIDGEVLESSEDTTWPTARNKYWLKLYDDRKSGMDHSPAKIRNHWNGLSDSERTAIAGPKHCAKIPEGTGGRLVVEEVIRHLKRKR